MLDNPELCGFLRDKVRAGLVEICLHGYGHSYLEFTTHDEALIQEKLGDGLQILHDAIPEATIRTFIAPYDRISPVALNRVLERGLNICTHSTNLAPSDIVPDLPGYQVAELDTNQWLYTCDEYLYTHRDEPAESLRLAHERLLEHDLLIIANHYWTFYHDWNDTPNAAMLESWRSFVDMLLAGEDIAIQIFYR